MRPPEARQISMARSSAQSECGELSTGTKTSLYGMTPPSAVMGSLNEFRIAGLLYKTHQSGRRANTPAHQHPSILAHFVREKLIRSLALRARSRSSREPPKTRRARYGQSRNTCQGPFAGTSGTPKPLAARIAGPRGHVLARGELVGTYTRKS